jgi:hypothetical protein
MGLRDGDECGFSQPRLYKKMSKNNLTSNVKGGGRGRPPHTLLTYRVAKKLLATTAPSTPTINLNAMRSAL